MTAGPEYYPKNGGFYDSSFSDDEKKQINKTTVRFEKSPSEISMAREGQDTEDYVFLLSYSEAKKYFRSDEARMCPVSPTAKANGGFEGYNGNCKWWLRTNSSYKNSFLVVNETGRIEELKGTVCYSEDICIRPVMWVSI